MQQAFSTLLGLAAITTLSAPAHSQSLTNFANVKSRGEIVQFRGDGPLSAAPPLWATSC
jgi:hypothetical protein